MPDSQHLRLKGAVPKGGRKTKQADGGRICSIPECTVVLSVYNHDKTCWLHAPFKVPRLRGRK